MTRDEILANLRTYARRKAGAMLPASEVDDAAQEAIVAAWRALDRLDPGRDPWPFLTMVVRQEVAMVARGFYAARTTSLEEEEHEGLPPVPPPSVEGDEEGLDLTCPRLRAAIDRLRPRQREILLATVADGRTNVAAASLLGISEASVRATKERALVALRADLGAAA